MTGASHSAGNTAKNILLVALVVLLGVLCAACWLTALNVSQMSANNPLRRVYDQLSGGAVGYELRSSGIAAAEPVQMAITVDGKLTGVQYNLADLEAGLEAASPLWAEVLGSAVQLNETDDQTLAAALAGGDAALLRYHGAIRVPVLAGWLGGSSNLNIAAETLVYTESEGLLFIRTGEGELYSAPAKVSADTIQRAKESFRGTVCEFSGSAYAVYPETLLFDQGVMTLPRLKATALDLFDAQGGGSLQTLLNAFQYTPYVRSYAEQDGKSKVFADDVSTMRVYADGLTQYTASGESGAISAYDRGEAEGLASLDAQLDCARTVLDTALRAVEAETRASLCGVQQEDGVTTLSFVQTYNGVPILGETDFATFVFRDGALLSASLHLQRFEAEDVRQGVMPARQAAAASDGSARELIVAYREQDGVYVPGRYYLK